MTAELPQAAPLASSVGSTLKSARIRLGKNLPEVGTQLRIRQPFLEALEEGRHKDLPGGTYAVGFLRTYAEFLNLDGEEMVRRFRQEAAGELNSRAEMVFPSPVSEGRIPGGAVLFVGLVVAGIAYGAWYWLSSKDVSVADMVPAIPERLAGVLHRTEAPPVEIKPADQPVAPPAEAKPEEHKPEEVKPAANDVVPPAEEEAPAAKTAMPEPVKVDSVKMEPIRGEVLKPAEPPKVEVAKPAEPAPAEIKVAEIKVIDVAKPAEPVNPVIPVADGKVIGADNAGSRITLKASADDCWVQVREMDGQLLLSRLLRRGDSYMVPNRPGLTLMVGNAGAIEITVDGKKAPAVGGAGQVRRDIKLEPEKLAGGNS